MKNILKNTMLMAASLLISATIALSVLEIFLRIFTTPSMTPGYVQTHPERRYALKPFFKGSTYSKMFQINSFGLRDRERPILENAYRIAVFGDSMTFGPGVDTENTFPKVLEVQLNKTYGTEVPIQVFNFGVPSYNTVQEYIYMRSSYAAFKPHMIIIQFSSQNDTKIIATEDSSINRYRAIRFIKDALRSLYSYDFLALKFYQLRYNRMARNYEDQYKARGSIDALYYREDYKGWIEAKKAFGGIKRFCDDNNVVLIFAVFANSFKLSPILEEDPMYPVMKKVISALKEAGVEHTIVLDETLRKYAGREFLLWATPEDAHFSELAHRLVADRLSIYIVTHDFIVKK